MAKKGSTSVKVNFDDVESSDFSIPNGSYVLTVTGVEKKKSEQSGNEYLAWEFKIAEGKHKGKKVWDNTSLQPQALWRLRGLLEAMQVDISEGEFELELDEFDGETLGVVIENEKYNGKDKPRIVSFMLVDDVGETEAEEEAPKAKPAASSKKVAKTVEPEEEAEEEEAAPPPSKKKKAAAPAFKVGQSVTFEDDGEDHTGKITAIDGDVVTVKVGKDEWELDVSEITAA